MQLPFLRLMTFQTYNCNLYIWGINHMNINNTAIHDMRNTKSNSGVFTERLALVFDSPWNFWNGSLYLFESWQKKKNYSKGTQTDIKWSSIPPEPRKSGNNIPPWLNYFWGLHLFARTMYCDSGILKISWTDMADVAEKLKRCRIYTHLTELSNHIHKHASENFRFDRQSLTDCQKTSKQATDREHSDSTNNITNWALWREEP